MAAQVALAVMRDFGWGGRFGPIPAAGFQLPYSLVGVYPVGVANGDSPPRVMSELAPISLERDAFSCGLSCYHDGCSRFFVFVFCLHVLAGHLPHHYQSLRVGESHSVA